MIKCVIFDFDGTLADTEGWALSIYNELAFKSGYRTYTIEEIEKLKKMPTLKAVQTTGIPYRKLFSMLNKGQRMLKKHINDVEAFSPRIKEFLLEIETLSGKIGIISSNTKKNIRRFLNAKHIENMDFIISSPLFSKETKIHSVLKKEKLHPEEVLYVGDELRDIEASKKAGIYIAAATWGYNARSLLQEAKPNFILESLEDVISILKSLQ